MNNDLLIELGCEELPPKSLKDLAVSFYENIKSQLSLHNVSHSGIEWYATPRRLAVLVKDVPEKQADKEEEKRGPATKIALDENGNLTKAGQGWVRSIGITEDEVEFLETDKGKWLYKKIKVEGKNISSLLNDVLTFSVKKLPIPKLMRWGNSKHQFVRPVHTVCVMHGENVIDIELFGIKSDSQVFGHRFHGSRKLTLSSASHYETVLENAFVLANFSKRKQFIENKIESLAAEENSVADLDNELLEEITSLVEWPEILQASFPVEFLEVPKEALIYTMKDDQRYIPLLSKDGQLLPKFLFVSNIASSNPNTVIQGNERVIRPRLHDAKFFFEEDKKISSESRLDSLSSIVFQKQLGTMHQRATRLADLASDVANLINADPEQAHRAGLLAKSDLVSHMVLEFPSVQGVMGRHYALNDGENAAVAQAIEEHYWPRYSGDKVPHNPESIAVAVAEKLDVLTGIFSIGMIPTGDKDPFALRRNAIGLLRILTENNLEVSLAQLLEMSFGKYQTGQEISEELSDNLIAFLKSRFASYYTERGYTNKNVNSVIATGFDSPFNDHLRLEAISSLMSSQEELILSISGLSKRVKNILAKQSVVDLPDVNINLFKTEEERTLYETSLTVGDEVVKAKDNEDYKEAISCLLKLQSAISLFFDNVIVNAEEEGLRNNRLALLKMLNQLFESVVDFSELA